MRQTTSQHRQPAQPAGANAGRRHVVTLGSEQPAKGAHATGSTAAETGDSKVEETSPERSESDDRALTYLVAFFIVSTVLVAVLAAGLAVLIASAGSATR